MGGWGIIFSRYLKNGIGVYAPPRNPLLEAHFRDGRIVNHDYWTLYPRDLKGLQEKLAQAVIEDGSSLIYALDAPLPGPMLPFLGLKSPTALKPYELAAKVGMPIIPFAQGATALVKNFGWN